jgi:hypothetical protein
MHEKIAEASKALEKIADSVEDLGTTILSQQIGWNGLPLAPTHLATLCRELAYQLDKDAADELPEEYDALFADVNAVLAGIEANILPNMRGNLQAGLPTLKDGILFVSALLSGYFGWSLIDKNKMPSALARKLIGLNRQVDQLIPDKDLLEKQIADIRDGYAAAEALPTTLTELKQTQSEVRSISSTSSEKLALIREAEKTAADLVEKLRGQAAESEALLKQASEAYRVTTTIGLAAAFDDRAQKLNVSVYQWVTMLAVSLILIIGIGAFRLEAMKDVLTEQSFNATKVWIQVLLSALSVGAPVWFAWICTKQIGQRFRLAEDYAFKASVSKAYEGYRREAASLDPSFAQTLFSSALKRLDEAPLRLLEMTTHGSPMHELANSKIVEKVLDKLPARTQKPKPAQEVDQS